MKTLKLASLILALAIACGCGGKVPPALVSTNPAEADVIAVKQKAERLFDGVQVAFAIVREVGVYVDTLPIPADAKNKLDQAIVAVTGTTFAPGPLLKALDRLHTLTNEPSLRATVTEVFALIDPLLAQWAATGDPGLNRFIAITRSALTFARSFLGSAPLALAAVSGGGVR